ncbi:MAG: PDZ domain-containing protein [Phycisphaerales bacterium]
MTRRPHRLIPAALVVLAGGVLTCPASSTLADQPAATTPEAGQGGANIRDGLRDIIGAARDKVFPALVNIHVITSDFYSGKETKSESVGSGTIISKKGYVLTNAHVVSTGKKFKVRLADKQEANARLVGEDPATDLAILQIDLKDMKDPASLPTAELGDSDKLQVGEYVLAMGSPFALSRSVTLGIVSNVERVFTSSFSGNDEVDAIDMIDGQRTGQYTRWIQHDALINPGNSGGPLVNLDGLVVGVNTRGGSGMGFASPANMVKDIAAKLIEFGEVPRSYIGVSLRQTDRTGIKEGVLVASVSQGSPADKAGLKSGDVVTRFNGEPMNIRFAEEIPAVARKIADTPIGGTLTLTVAREGSPKDLTITTEKLLKDRGEKAAVRGWGFSAEEITDFYAREDRLENRDGVLVTGVRGGGPAALAEPQINPGDIVRAVGGKTVKNLEEMVAAYRSIMDQETIPEHLLVEFERRGKNQVTVIKPRPDKPQDPPREAAKAWLGVATQPVLRELADQLGSGELQGFRVTRVYPKTRAADSELKVGDIVTAINGERVQPRGMQDAGLLSRKIRNQKIDDQAKLTVMRGTEKKEIDVSLERTRIGPEEARRDENKDFELSVRELTFFDRDDNKWDDSVQGVLVSSAERAGWAALGGLFPGDLIQRIDEAVITDILTYRKAMEAIAKKQPERITFVVLRGTRTSYRFVEPEWKPTLDKETKPATAPK